MTDDDPLDLTAVAADDAAVERLRSGAPMDDDAVLALLQGLLADVETDLPAPGPVVPVGRGSTVLMLAGEGAPERRWARGGAVVAVLTAGVVSLGGVAAASTLAPVGSPLHGLGEAVRSAAGAVVGAVTPPTSPERPVVAAASPSPSPSPAASVRPQAAPSGAAVAAAARSQAAAAQVARLLDQAEQLIDGGRTPAAKTRLDLAGRKLAEVLPAERAPLAQRLEALRTRLAAQPAAPAKQKPPAKPEQSKPDPQPEPKKAQPKGNARTTAPGSGGKDSGKAGKDSGKAGQGSGSLLGQVSDSDASAKPRA